MGRQSTNKQIHKYVNSSRDEYREEKKSSCVRVQNGSSSILSETVIWKGFPEEVTCGQTCKVNESGVHRELEGIRAEGKAGAEAVGWECVWHVQGGWLEQREQGKGGKEKEGTKQSPQESKRGAQLGTL